MKKKVIVVVVCILMIIGCGILFLYYQNKEKNIVLKIILWYNANIIS